MVANPLAFTRGPVTFFTTAIYVALIAVLIVVQVDLPSLPSSPTPYKGINLTEAWYDLQLLTAEYHPYNSYRNDVVHGWLLSRIDQILTKNKASETNAYVFNDLTSNLTSSTSSVAAKKHGISVYFEGTNIIVYVRGSEDDKKSWWNEEDAAPSEQHGVLVNAHYDSVSTGYGSTDDGVGVVSILQLLRYFTTKGNEPKYGLVLLLNNGEEDFLNGARAFGQHPMSKFVKSFLNLEGAGAGGRAALFRSTDEEVTRAYAKSPHPFGTAVSGDAFQRGLVRSQTDYVVFNGAFGYRGLDVAFIGPRSRYHTSNDDSRHTGKKAMWHMLSGAVATTRQLTRTGISDSTDIHRSIWFDVLGRGFALLQAHTFFALSVTVLVVGPVLLLLTLVILSQADKNYLFSSNKSVHTADGDQPVKLYGWRGFLRFPLIMIPSAAGPIGLAYLLSEQNEEIVHSSPWPVWAMMTSAFIYVAWFLSRFADYVRPSALTRAYGYGWICFGWWAILVVALVYEEQFHLSGGYVALFFSASAFMTTWFCYLELFSLPKKRKYAREQLAASNDSDNSRESTRPGSSGRPGDSHANDNEEEATEQSSLLQHSRTVYSTVSKDQQEEAPGIVETTKAMAKHEEQEWSANMWDWMWLFNLILIVPTNVILLGQLGFYLTEALHQTGQDGSSVFLVYISIAIVTIFMLSPLVPMLHRLSWLIPTFLLLVLIGTLIYNLLAFPFSSQNQLKLYFQQQIDLDNGNNSVSLLGLSPYVEQTIAHVPSAQGQDVRCESVESRKRCSWTGVTPQVVESNAYVFAKKPYQSWLNYNGSIIGSAKSTTTARISISGKNTRACKFEFDLPISSVHVQGQSAEDERLPGVPEGGSQELRLWSRTWNRTWTVDVTWDSKTYGSSLTGRAIGLWSDINQKGVIPAFDEVQHYMPTWAAITKAADGLVEGYKAFNISS